MLAVRLLRELARAGGVLSLLENMLAEMLSATEPKVQAALEVLRAAGVPVCEREAPAGAVYSVRAAELSHWLSGAGGSIAGLR